MRKITPCEWANAFVWLCMIVAAIILLWGTKNLWPMVVVLLAGGVGSMLIVNHVARGA